MSANDHKVKLESIQENAHCRTATTDIATGQYLHKICIFDTHVLVNNYIICTFYCRHNYSSQQTLSLSKTHKILKSAYEKQNENIQLFKAIIVYLRKKLKLVTNWLDNDNYYVKFTS